MELTATRIVPTGTSSSRIVHCALPFQRTAARKPRVSTLTNDARPRAMALQLSRSVIGQPSSSASEAAVTSRSTVKNTAHAIITAASDCHVVGPVGPFGLVGAIAV
jgi:hypothetical protein